MRTWVSNWYPRPSGDHVSSCVCSASAPPLNQARGLLAAVHKTGEMEVLTSFPFFDPPLYSHTGCVKSLACCSLFPNDFVNDLHP